MFLFAKRTADRRIAQRAANSRRTERTIAVRSIAACAKWTIFVLGTLNTRPVKLVLLANWTQGRRRGVGDILQVFHSVRCLYGYFLYIYSRRVCVFHGRAQTPGERIPPYPTSLLLTCQDWKREPSLVRLHWIVSIFYDIYLISF